MDIKNIIRGKNRQKNKIKEIREVNFIHYTKLTSRNYDVNILATVQLTSFQR